MSGLERLQKVAELIQRIVHPINRILHYVAMIVLFMLMLLTTGDVLGRRLAAPIPGTFELTELAMVFLVYFSLGYTQVKKGHVEIDLIVSRLSERKQAMFEIFTYLLSLILLILVAWQLLMHAVRLWTTNNMTGVLSLSLYPFAVFAAIGTLAFGLSVISDLANSWIKVVQRK